MKALIIGFGSIGKKHFIALKKLGYDVEICSKSFKKDKFKNHKIKIHSDLSDINLENFELFIISNITVMHFDTLSFLDKNLKNKTILVEKPLFETYKDFKSTQNNRIYVAYLLRFHPVIKALKKLLSYEKPYFANFVCNSYLPNWREVDYTQNYSAKKELGGGVLLDLSHELDLAQYLFKDLELLYSQNEKISELDISSDDFAFLALKGKNEEKVFINLDYFSKKNSRTINICTEKRSFKADLNKNYIKIYKKSGKVKKIEFKNSTIKNLCLLHKAILKNDKNICSLDEGLQILRLTDKVKNG